MCDVIHHQVLTSRHGFQAQSSSPGPRPSLSALLLAAVLWFSLPSLALPDYSDFISSPLLDVLLRLLPSDDNSSLWI